MLSHTLPLRCSCGGEFQTWGAYQEHFWAHHASKSSGWEKCPRCGAYVGDLGSLLAHWRDTHTVWASARDRLHEIERGHRRDAHALARVAREGRGC